MKPTKKQKRFFKLLLILLILSLPNELYHGRNENILMLLSIMTTMIIAWRYFWTSGKSLIPMLVATAINVVLSSILLFIVPALDFVSVLSSILMVLDTILAVVAMMILRKDPGFLAYIGIEHDE